MVEFLVTLTAIAILWLFNYYGLGYLQGFAYRKRHIKSDYPLRRHLLVPSSILIAMALLPVKHSQELTEWIGWGSWYQVPLITCVVWLLWTFFQVVFQSLYLRLDISKEDNFKSRKLQTQLIFIERLIDISIGFLGVVAILFTYEPWYQIGRSLLTSAGVLSVILGLAAQKYLGNLIAGFQIAFTQPIRIDDAVVVENEWGWIEEITLTYVVVRIWDLRRLVLPISYFTEKPFQNWTRKTAEVIGSVTLQVDFSLDVDSLREELDRILEETPLWNRQVKVVHVTEAEERSMTLRILVSAQNSPKCWDLRCYVREQLVKFIASQPTQLSVQRLQLQNRLLPPDRLT